MVWSSPDNTTQYTHGPDCDTGANCCCGKCDFFALATDCDNSVCCKCVPKNLCAVFHPNNIDTDCIYSATEMTFAGAWVGSIDGIDPIGSSDQIEVHMVKDESYQACYFRVLIPAREIDDLYLIESGKRECSLYPRVRLTCKDPYFEYPDFELNGCIGTLIIQRKELAKVPFASVKTEFLSSTTIADEVPCGVCTEYCNVLCMEWSVGSAINKSEFKIQLDTPTPYWTHKIPDGPVATISLEDIDGQCHFVIDHDGLGEFDKIPIPYQMCNIGMVIEFQGTGDNSAKHVSISCNRCTCWDYICETCRCVCKTMCIVSVDGPNTEDITYYELEWDDIALRWGTDEKWVGIKANPETGKCEYVISGWNDGLYSTQYDTENSTIEIEECGKDMSYFVTMDEEKAFELGTFKFEYGVCKTCNPDCFQILCQDCCTDCESRELPDTLYIDLFGGFTAGGEDPGEDAANCLTVLDIPLVHTAPLFAELHRWTGTVIVECGCPLDPLTPDPSPNATRIDIVVTCIGGDQFQLTLSMKGRTAGSGGSSADSTNPLETTSFSCNPITWVGRFLLNPGFDADEDNCCCPLAHEFTFVVSE
jgi:hypothetical protein